LGNHHHLSVFTFIRTNIANQKKYVHLHFYFKEFDIFNFNYFKFNNFNNNKFKIGTYFNKYMKNYS